MKTPGELLADMLADMSERESDTPDPDKEQGLRDATRKFFNDQGVHVEFPGEPKKRPDEDL